MKIDTKKYAQVLRDALKGRNEKEIKQTIKEFAEILYTENLLSKKDKIISDFIDIWNKEENIFEAELITAYNLTPVLEKVLSGYLLDRKKVGKVFIKKTIDKSILGGFIIKYEDKVIDGSLRTRLDDLRSAMNK